MNETSDITGAIKEELNPAAIKEHIVSLDDLGDVVALMRLNGAGNRRRP